MTPSLAETLAAIVRRGGRVTVLTGAGISAESGIPTFRGPEGYWTVGSKVYQPQEMATRAMFDRQPEAVWRWYLYRRGVCLRAEPNAGHRALAQLEARLGDRFTLITQNVDGLHLRAGNSAARTYQIHGNIHFMRCARACTAGVYPIPGSVPPKEKDSPLTSADRRALRCPRCGGLTRPHVLWFDEYYDETYYRFESSLRVAARTDLLIVVGTSGATNLPNQVAWLVVRRGGVLVDVNIQPNPFAELAQATGGFVVQRPAARALPSLVQNLAGD
ncbi:MAG: RNA polymerase subunit sigma [Caldilineae bacterium]|nr:MAG: RNA polymerase subunit sigma [Caldilineae bacterium]